MPPDRRNFRGFKLRKVGFELEFSGIEFSEIAKIIMKLYGGEHIAKDRFVNKVVKTKFGDFRIEMDASLLTKKEYEGFFKKIGAPLDSKPVKEHAGDLLSKMEKFLIPKEISNISGFFTESKLIKDFNKLQSELFASKGEGLLENLSSRKFVEDVLSAISETFVPFEVCTPPIPINKLGEIEKFRQALYEGKALGTNASIIYAFGLHLNPEIASRKPKYLLNCMRAFLLLYDHIVEDSEVDFSRRISPFIKEFPQKYVAKILNMNYNPSLDRLIDDYLEYNSTRNRPLDMLPVFTFLDKERIRAALPKEKISSRPTFHYRLPNCCIDLPDWCFAKEWNYWAAIENLAADEKKLTKVAADYLETIKSFSSTKRWIKKTREWLQVSQ